MSAVLRNTEGAKKGGGGGGSESPDTLTSNETIKILHLLGEGEINLYTGDAKSIYLNSTPLQNSDDSYNFGVPTWEFRTGTPSQTVMSNPAFPYVSQIFSVNQQVLGGTTSPPVSPAPVTYSITSALVDYAKVTVSFPNGILQADSKGNITGDRVNVEIDVKPRASATWVNAIKRTVRGKNDSNFRMQFEVNNPNPGELWDIRVRRTTEDNETATRKNAVWVFDVVEVQKVNLTYPGIAYLGIEFNAQNIGGENANIPITSFLVSRGPIAIPSNYNPDTFAYSGTWDGTFTTGVTDNPTWVLYDMLTNPKYGMYLYGIRAEMIDKGSFYSASIFNDTYVDDGRGSTERRFTFNGVLQNRQDCLTSIQQVAGMMNASLAYVDGLITLIQDRPKYAQYAITKSNVMGSDPNRPVYFTYTGSPKTQRSNVLHVTYINAESPRYLPSIVSVQDDDALARYGYQPKDIAAFGATTPGQAMRAGRFWLYENNYNTEHVSFRQGFEGFNIRLDDVFELFDDDYAGRAVGGRVVSATINTVTLDQPVIIDESVTTTISIFHQDGSTYQTYTVTNAPGTYSTLTISGGFSPIPDKYSTYGVTSSVGPRTFKVNDIQVDSISKEISITAKEYSRFNYDYIEGDYVVPDEIYTQPQINPPLPPTNLVVTPTQFIDPEDKLLIRGVVLTWDRPNEQNISYVIKYRKDNGNFTTLAPTVSTSYTFDNIVTGQYDFIVYSINVLGQYSMPASISYTLDTSGGGTSATLSEITTLQVVGGGTTWTGTDLTCEFTNPAANQGLLKDFLVTVKTTADVVLRQVVVPPVNGGIAQSFTYPLADNEDDGGPRRSLKITVQGRDSLNNTTTGITATLTNSAPAVPDNISATPALESALISWTPLTDTDVAGYIVWFSSTNGFTPSSGNAKDVGMSSLASFIDLTKSTTYYYRVAAYDIFSKDLSGSGLNVSSQLSTTTPSKVGIPSGSSLPGSGNTGDFFFNTTDSLLYQFSGGAWKQVGVPTGSSLPGSANEGDTFYNTTTNTLYTYDGSTWVPVGILSVSSLPGTGTTGQVVYLTSDQKLYRWNGSAWIKAVDGGDITANTIAANSLVVGTITGTYIAADTISTSHIIAGTIQGSDIAATTISAGNIVSGTITTTQIAATTITGGNIAASTITANKLSVSTLDAISANVGTLTAGLISNNSGTNTINLSATGSTPFISTPNFSILANGNASFSGALTAASGTFSGTLTASNIVTTDNLESNAASLTYAAKVGSTSNTTFTGDGTFKNIASIPSSFTAAEGYNKQVIVSVSVDATASGSSSAFIVCRIRRNSIGFGDQTVWEGLSDGGTAGKTYAQIKGAFTIVDTPVDSTYPTRYYLDVSASGASSYYYNTSSIYAMLLKK
jgi:predicted phage tail protein